MSGPAMVLDAADVHRALVRIAHEIVERNKGTDGLVVVGIHTRGCRLAGRLAAKLAEIEGRRVPAGALDVAMYRDDIGMRPPQATHDTELPFDLAGKVVVLVDDVLYTGRTVRAAWTPSPTSAGRGPSSWPCWSTAATVSCPCGPTTSARTCPPPPTRRSGSCWPRPTARTAWSSRTRPGRRWPPEEAPAVGGRPDRRRHHRVLDTAAHLAKVTDRAIKKVPPCAATVCNLFFEDSTRTRISFELAAKRLSADVINFSAKGSSVSKGESLKDTAITLEAMGVDAIVIRHGASGAPWRLAEWVEAVVVNAGDGTHEHPTQALLDLYTIRQRFPGFDGLKVAIVGDVLHSRVARSNVLALTTMGPRSPWSPRRPCSRPGSRPGGRPSPTTWTRSCPSRTW